MTSRMEADEWTEDQGYIYYTPKHPVPFKMPQPSATAEADSTPNLNKNNRSEDPYAYLKQLPRLSVKPNPYSINELLEAGRTKPINDMYTERVKPNSDLICETDELKDLEALLDLYSERLKKKRK